jgi:hypothetical protein
MALKGRADEIEQLYIRFAISVSPTGWSKKVRVALYLYYVLYYVPLNIHLSGPGSLEALVPLISFWSVPGQLYVPLVPFHSYLSVPGSPGSLPHLSLPV